ncbi:MAG: DnaJ domain-containing protein [Patescibacteria group bacterium]|nr:DnaJ domain-containing protein [Patescibacteria group bacterium]
MADYYELLGLSKNASVADIKAAYRKKALEWHPDRNKSPDAEKTFKEINRAYEVLSDPKKRQIYDQVGHAAYEKFGGRAAGGYPGGGAAAGQGPFGGYTYTGRPEDFGFDFDVNFNDPFEIFEQFFGGQSPFGGRARTRRPLYQMKLTFDEAVKGVEKETVIGGKTRKIKIPAGVDSGTTIRFEDFDLTVEVAPHKYFKREGQNVIYEQEISIPDAVLGTTIEVPTIDGSVKLKVRPGTASGSVVRLKDRGIPYPRSNRRGDQYIVFKIKIPENLSGKGKKLMEELRKELS